MTGILLWVIVSAGALENSTLSYNEAYETAHKSKKPMVILVGADWCPACRVMKQYTMPGLLRDGKLSQVSYTLVDVDDSPRISSGLMRSNSIPQLVVCVPMSSGWQRFYLHGGQSPDRVEALVRDCLAAQQRDFAAAKNGNPATAAVHAAGE